MNKKLLAIGFILAAILVAMFFMSKIKYEDFALTDKYGKNLAVDFPFSAKSQKDNESAIYELKGKIHLNVFSSRNFRIIPDDKVLSLVVNGEEVSLSSIPENKRNDWRNGFTINLSKYMNNGENSIEIKFEDLGGLMGIKMQPLLRDLRTIVFYVLTISFLLFLLFIFSKKNAFAKKVFFYTVSSNNYPHSILSSN